MNAIHPFAATAAQWETPSPRVRALLSKGAEIALNAPPDWLEEIEQASLAAEGRRPIDEDPVLMAATRRATRASLMHWAVSNIDQPGVPVAPHVSPDMLDNARELVRRGATDLAFNSSRSVQNTAWQLWMNIAFSLTSDPKELQELLVVSAQSIAGFIDGTMMQIAAFMQAEREALMRGTHVDRRELVTRILEGRAVDAQQASQRLGYVLSQTHHAAVLWSEEAGTELQTLEAAAEALVRCGASRDRLTVLANAGTLWVWLAADREPDLAQLRHAIRPLPGVRVAIGARGQGVDGFRRSHLQALTTQRLLGRLHTSERVVSFDMVRLVSLMMHDADATRRFVADTLGDLATAPAPLRRALLTYLRCGCNVTEAAEVLHTHRNTLLRRLARAEELLPRPLAEQRIHVAAALEVVSWDEEGE